ncbi:hypothetical protein GCM10009676_25230 [Prauserella halophila]|uniref:Uncharacterized protein n=1 Tax=Prauserella halophila TaxID=185641 RepID=A0ABP4GVL1_9PSEU
MRQPAVENNQRPGTDLIKLIDRVDQSDFGDVAVDVAVQHHRILSPVLLQLGQDRAQGPTGPAGREILLTWNVRAIMCNTHRMA